MYRWSGGDKGADAWYRTLKGYFTGACPMIKPILDWVESKDEAPIDDEEISLESMNWMIDGESPIVLSQHVWKFLQMVVSGTAANTFKASPELNGFDAWRALIWDVNRGRAGRMMKMHDEVHKPNSVRTYTEVPDLLNRYVTNLMEFKSSNGVVPSDLQMKQSLLRAFPQELREALLLKAAEPETLMQFIAHVRTKIAFILQCRGQTSSPAHNLEDVVQPAKLVDDQMQAEEMQDIDSMDRDISWPSSNG